MKTANIGLASLLILGLAGSANAQTSAYQDPDQCSAEVTALDVDRDGYITNAEIAGRGTIETNVDTDGDGRISSDEVVVACDSKLMDALTPRG
jgi:hypothetical protein